MSENRETPWALIAAVAGSILSLGMLLYAARRGTPLVVLILMVGWVLSPFVLMGVAYSMASRWTASARTSLRRVMVLIAVGSVAIYAVDTVNHIGGKPAAIFVLVPPISWLVGLAVVGAAAIRTRTKRA